jgi:hypothetical protein
MDNNIVYCQPDLPARGKARKGDNPTVSFKCERCSRPGRGGEVRHTHGNPARYDKPGQVVGDRVSHCDSGGGDILLVIGPEPKSPGTPVVDHELAELFA